MSEYWIEEDGDVQFADGDIGDLNHEGVVIDRVRSEIIEKTSSHFRGSGKYFDSGSDWDEFKDALANAYAKEFIQKNPKKRASVEKSLNYDPEKFTLAALKESGVTKQEWETAEGNNDARDYAMERWGWKTYRNGNVDTWRCTRKDMSAIIDGLESISEQDGWSDKKFKKYKFTINIFSTKKFFNLTIEQMKKWINNPTAQITQDEPQDIYKPSEDLAKQFSHPYYHNRPGVNPYGDSVLYSFKAFLEGNNGK